MEIVCITVSVFSMALAAVMYVRTSQVMKRMDEMVEAVIDGTFSEQDYTEQRLSRLEAKMYHYLCAGRMERRQMALERDGIKTLVSDISHQTKTPIANILLYTQLLCEQDGLDENAKKIAGQAESQAEKLNFLIQSLIKTSRLENGIVEVQPEKNRVRELMGHLECPAQAQTKGVDFCIDRDVPDLYAYFDPKWTLEALLNIVDNGVKYTPKGGSVTVSVQDYEMFVRIDIDDTGIGISEEDSARIFGRFYRAPAVREEKGVGIGLYLAREILSREGGYIKVSSELQKGSRFSVFLSKQQNLSKL